MTLSTSLGELFGQWIARREAQVHDLLAAGVDRPADVAARLDMTVVAAQAYLDRILLRAAAGTDRAVAEGGAEEMPSRFQQPAQEGALGRLIPPCEAAGVLVPPRPPGRASA